MPQSEDSFELLDETGGLLHAPTFINDFGPYRWTYIAGYPNLVETFYLAEGGFPSLKVVKEHVEGQRARALGAIPSGWKARCPEGQWSECHIGQIQLACRGHALRFDKACVAVQTLALVFADARAEALRTLDVYRFLKLRPAVFVFIDLDAKSEALLRQTSLTPEEQVHHDRLVTRLSPPDGHDEVLDRRRRGSEFLTAVADGYGITFHNASLIADFLASIGMARPRIAVLGGRTDKGRMTGKKHCNEFEPVFVSLKAEELQLLQELSRPRSPDPAAARRR